MGNEVEPDVYCKNISFSSVNVVQLSSISSIEKNSENTLRNVLFEVILKVTVRDHPLQFRPFDGLGHEKGLEVGELFHRVITTMHEIISMNRKRYLEVKATVAWQFSWTLLNKYMFFFKLLGSMELRIHRKIEIPGG